MCVLCVLWWNSVIKTTLKYYWTSLSNTSTWKETTLQMDYHTYIWLRIWAELKEVWKLNRVYSFARNFWHNFWYVTKNWMIPTALETRLQELSNDRSHNQRWILVWETWAPQVRTVLLKSITCARITRSAHLMINQSFLILKPTFQVILGHLVYIYIS